MNTLVRVAVTVLLLSSAAGGTRAAVGVHQPLMPPVPFDPLDFPDRSSPIDLQACVYRLGDGTRAEWYHLNGWTRLTSRVSLGGGISYTMLEEDGEVGNGGAPAWVALSTHLGGPGRFGLAFDIDGTVPFGDDDLYPVSSDAASVGLRVRLSPGWVAGGRSWIGWRTRRVSPPSKGNRPDGRPGEDWPSGSALVAGWHTVTPRWDGALIIRYDMAGLPETFWYQGEATWYPTGDLGLRVGAAATSGPAEHRPMDWSWLVGVRWRPAAVHAVPGAGDLPAGK